MSTSDGSGAELRRPRRQPSTTPRRKRGQTPAGLPEVEPTPQPQLPPQWQVEDDDILRIVGRLYLENYALGKRLALLTAPQQAEAQE